MGHGVSDGDISRLNLGLAAGRTQYLAAGHRGAVGYARLKRGQIGVYQSIVFPVFRKIELQGLLVRRMAVGENLNRAADGGVDFGARNVFNVQSRVAIDAVFRHVIAVRGDAEHPVAHVLHADGEIQLESGGGAGQRGESGAGAARDETESAICSHLRYQIK